ncbi:HEPN domain-containing protein [Thermus tenuipuniceus]|uniref:HEPN domain-containing protein n=1 Tax=Thermus tenuipuniceus TaxID=2078690 RepID=UPI000CF89B8F|nr:HEPN domain-containing protein [Thermus tenuipuniceus]
MPLEPTDPWSWLRLTKSDLAYAAQTPQEALFEPSAFLAEQAAEKAIKALLVSKEATLLMEYTLRGRYPAGLPKLTQEEGEEALELARRVVAWVESLLSEGHG